MSVQLRREAAVRIMVVAAIVALCLLWPTFGTAVVAGLGVAQGVGKGRA